MKYRINKHTVTYDLLTDLRVRMAVADEAAKQFCESVGSGSTYILPTGRAAGQPIAFEFDEKPEGWKQITRSGFMRYYAPKKIATNQVIVARLRALPIVEVSEINSVVNFKSPQTIIDEDTHRYTTTRSVNIWWGDDYHLMEVNEKADYTPPDDLIELTVSEFNQLLFAIKEKQANGVAAN